MADLDLGENNKNEQEKDDASLAAEQQQPAQEQQPQAENKIAEPAVMAGLPENQLGMNANPTNVTQDQTAQKDNNAPDAQHLRNDAEERATPFGTDIDAQKMQYNKGLSGEGDGMVAGVANIDIHNQDQTKAEEEKNRRAAAIVAMTIGQLQDWFGDVEKDANQAIAEAEECSHELEEIFLDIQQSAHEAGKAYSDAFQKLQELKANGASDEEIEEQQRQVDLERSIYESQAGALENVKEVRARVQEQTGELQKQINDLKARLENASPEEAEQIKRDIETAQQQVQALKQEAKNAITEARETQGLSNKITELSKDGELSKSDITALKEMAGDDPSKIALVKDIALKAAAVGVAIEGGQDFLAKIFGGIEEMYENVAEAIVAALENQGITITPSDEQQTLENNDITNTMDLAANTYVMTNFPTLGVMNFQIPTIAPPSLTVDNATPAIYTSFADSPEFAATNAPNVEATYAAPTQNNTNNVVDASNRFAQALEQPAAGTAMPTPAQLAAMEQQRLFLEQQQRMQQLQAMNDPTMPKPSTAQG